MENQPYDPTWLEAERRHCWHPFTRQQEWCAPDFEPLALVKGRGVWLWDTRGRRYFDGNSTIWTNIHGHCHPHIAEAVRRQLERVEHVSFLGFTHPWAAELAEKLCAFFPPRSLERVFFSDDGSTAVEVALKMAVQYRRQSGQPERRAFAAFSHGYHGDTLGAASLGGVDLFTGHSRGIGFETRHVAGMDALRALEPDFVARMAGVVIEPLIQGVNRLRVWPAGMLRELREWCTGQGVHLILDEVMTGFGRTGAMFACQREDVVPDFLCLAKGITGGFLPLAATLTTGQVYDAFLGGAERAFYYGHSYTANPLGCAAALASLELFATERTLERLPGRIAQMRDGLAALKARFPEVHDVRQVGMVAGMELRRPDGTRHAPERRRGEEFCLAARAHGLLTRPILDTVVLMPPLCVTAEELAFALDALEKTLAARPPAS